MIRLFPLYIVICFGFIGYSMMITLFTPLFMTAQCCDFLPAAASIQYRVITLGVVLALFPFAQLFGSPILGALSDHFGRKPILILSSYVTPISYALIALSLMYKSLTLLMIGSFIAGLAQANIAIAQSAIADVAPREERNRFFGYVYLSASTAYIIGPLLGGKLADASLVPWFNYSTPFWVVCVLLVITLFLVTTIFQETKQEKTAGVAYREALKGFWSIFTSRRLRQLYLINFLLYFVIFGFFRCYPMYIVNAFNLDVSRLSEFVAWVSVPIILVNVGVTGALSKRFSPKTLTLWTALFMGIFMIAIVLPTTPKALWLTLFLTGAAVALALPSSATMLSLAAPHREQGTAMGNNQALQVAAEALAALVGGLIAAITVKISLVVMGLAAGSVALVILTERRSRARN